MLRVVRTAIAVGAVGVIAACSAATMGQSTAPSTTSQAAVACRPIDLRTSAGVRIVLTGTWHGNDNGYYSFFQSGDCVWAMGISAHHAVMLRGTVMNDFTVPVEFARVACDPLPGECHGFGTDLLEIEVDGGSIVLKAVQGGELGIGSGIAVTEWTRVSETPVFPPPTPGI